MAVPSLKGTPGTALFGTAATLAPTHPTHATGDIIVVFAASSANASVTPTHSISDGTWALITSGVIASGVTRSRISAYWKRATSGAETALTVTFTPTGSTTCHHAAWSHVYQNCIGTGTPYEGANNNGAAGAAAIAVTRGATTTDRLSVISAHHADNVGTTWSEDHADAYTTRQSTDNATGIDGNSYCADFGPVDDNETVTMTVAGGGTGVGISGLAFALIGSTSTTHELTGAPALTYAAAGSPSRDAQISGATALAFGAAGTLTGESTHQLVGAPALAFGAVGVPAVETTHQLSGSPALVFSASGGPGLDLLLSGTSVMAFGVAGELTVTGSSAPVGAIYSHALGGLPHPWWQRRGTVW